MRPLASLAALIVLAGGSPCEHRARGASKPIDLDTVARAHAEAARAIRFHLERAARVQARLPGFESGLPACRTRTVRRVAVEALTDDVPPLYFAPAGSRARDGSVLVATSARSIEDVDAIADGAVAARFGVRCWPTLVRPVSQTEVELVEGD